MHEFPNLAPVAIAYLLAPRSSAAAERPFSLLGHSLVCTVTGGDKVQMRSDRLGMSDLTLDSSSLVYINKRLYTITV